VIAKASKATHIKMNLTLIFIAAVLTSVSGARTELFRVHNDERRGSAKKIDARRALTFDQDLRM
jgi:hypothetical protein